MDALDNPGWVSDVLKNHNLRLQLSSPDGRYRIVYSTKLIPVDVVTPEKFIRDYWLETSFNNGIINAPWDEFRHEQQVTIVTNLIVFANYSVESIVCGWKLRCPKCGMNTETPIWRNLPAQCSGKHGSQKCNYSFLEKDKSAINSDWFPKTQRSIA
jgi:hypothetical protein